MAILKEEFVKRANVHQTHFEDLIMLGEGGIEEFNDKIEKFMSGDSEMNYTTKIDGSPALFIWSKFPGYPDNSICLKSFVANANNCMSSVEEIDSKYGDRPDMAEKLKYGLEIAKSIPENECWQGDCLFGTNDKKVENIRGKEYVTFHPNKIVYAFSEENASFEKVVNSSFGIAFHTIYRPNGDGGKSQSFRVDASRLKNLPNDIFVLSPALNYSQDQFDKSKLETLYENLRELEDELLSDDAYHGITSNDVFMAYWNTFENANIADKRKTTLDIRTFFNDLWEYIDEKQTKEWTKRNLSLKTVKSRSAAYDKWVDSVQEMHEFLKHNKDTLVKMVQAFNLAADIKMELWNGFKGTKNDYSTFYKSRTKGILDADMEGIAMSDADGNIVKIVDRSEFSANNRDNDIMSGWEHPEDKLKEDMSSEEAAHAAGEYYKRTRGLPYDNTPLWVKQGRHTHSLYDYDPEKEKEEIAKFNAWFKEKNKADRKAKFQKIKNVIFGKPSDTLGCGYADLTEGKLKESYYSSSWSMDDTEVALQMVREFAEKHHNVIKTSSTKNNEAIVNIDGSDFYCTIALGDCVNLQENKNYGYHIFISGKKLTNREDWWGDTLEEFKKDLEEFDSVYHFAETGLKLNEAVKTVVCAFGRMNPPTIGHKKLIDTMAELAKPTRRKARLYLSHSHDNNKNPLDFDTKLRFCKEAFEPQIKVMNSGAKTIIHIFHELYEEGFENVIYVGGEDRIGGEEDMTKIISKYNGYGTEKLPLYYKFDSIQFESAGHRDDSSNSEVERASGSLARRLAADGKWRLFKRIMPFEEDTARELYDILRGRLRENLFESILRILHEGINISNIKSAIKNYIKSKVEEPLEVAESNRHKEEICRIKATNLDYDENFVLDTLKDILGNGYCEIPYKKDEKIKIETNFELVTGISGAYYSICLNVTYNGQEDKLYITDMTRSVNGTKSKGKKLFVPNNVLKPEILGQYSSLDEIIENINFKNDANVDMFLKELAKAAKTATTTDLDIAKYLTSTASERSDISSNTIELSFNSTPELDKIIETIGQDNIAEYSNSIGVDFGEVFGSIALASVLEKYGNNNPEMAIMFPPESNYPLVDYFIKPLDETQEYKISAKAGAGGQATIGDSCKVISTMVDQEWGPEKKLLKERYANSISFVRWFTEISKKSVHESFKAIAQSLLGTLGLGPYEQLSLDFLSPEIMAMLSGQIENINKIYKIKPSYSNLEKICEITNIVIDSFNLPRTSMMSIKDVWTEEDISKIQAPNQLEIYFDSLKIKCLCKILINVLNNSDIISGFNDLFNMSFGTFIQIYFKQVLIEKGTNYKFNAVIKSVTGEDSFGKDSFYELSMDCSIDKNAGQFKTKKLAMKLRH